ncbi:Uncharacterised protein [Streptococcus pneumoniae]|nr:Uncharacterised protein [Streptococcus pneumoniae]CZD08247.1 Uncharacterised protein [Streptococcus pneumoniae]VIX25104.1 Uncharacterised protein [Streptococcus pneumoniae]VMX42739.1 Uncharacterised protein [Streptococcus pneumoniae]VQD13367.1 Uncharacterised protein [Streptococcus pneumoniae]
MRYDYGWRFQIFKLLSHPFIYIMSENIITVK